MPLSPSLKVAKPLISRKTEIPISYPYRATFPACCFQEARPNPDRQCAFPNTYICASTGQKPPTGKAEFHGALVGRTLRRASSRARIQSEGGTREAGFFALLSLEKERFRNKS
jgi:hypothetical protein